MVKRKSTHRVLIEGFMGIIFFLILVGVLNLVSFYVGNSVLNSSVEFVNTNIIFILIISFVILIANVFASFPFPFNIFYPLFNAVGGGLWVIFLFRIFMLIDALTNVGLSIIFAQFYFLAIVLVPVVVLIVGYASIIRKLTSRRKRLPEKKEDGLEWKDVGDEFKEAAHNLGSTLKETFEPKKARKKAKKKAKKKVKKKSRKKK